VTDRDGYFPGKLNGLLLHVLRRYRPPDVERGWLYQTSWQLSYTGGDVGSPTYKKFWMHPELFGQAGKVARELVLRVGSSFTVRWLPE
jgi:hypothetical protein